MWGWVGLSGRSLGDRVDRRAPSYAASTKTYPWKCQRRPGLFEPAPDTWLNPPGWGILQSFT